MHGDGVGGAVNSLDEFVAGRYQGTVLQLEQNVNGTVINGCNAPNGFAIGHINNVKTHKGCQRRYFFCLFGQGTREIDVTTGQFLGTLLGIDVAMPSMSSTR